MRDCTTHVLSFPTRFPCPDIQRTLRRLRTQAFLVDRNRRTRNRLSAVGGNKMLWTRMLRKASVGRDFRKGGGRLWKTSVFRERPSPFHKSARALFRNILLCNTLPRPQVPVRVLPVMTADKRDWVWQVRVRSGCVSTGNHAGNQKGLRRAIPSIPTSLKSSCRAPHTHRPVATARRVSHAP